MTEIKTIKARDMYVMTELNLQKFMEHSKLGGDALLLYLGYQQQCRRQKTNQTRSTDVFMIKKLKRGKGRFQKAKKLLKEMGFIEIITDKKQGVILKWYVKVNFMINLEASKYHNLGIEDSEKESTNALNNKNKCLKKSNKNIHEMLFHELDFQFGLAKKTIENLFEHKKSLERIKECCLIIEQLSQYFNLEAIYDKQTINAIDIILSNQFSIIDIIDFITECERIKEDMVSFSDVIRPEYYLPEEMKNWSNGSYNKAS